MDWKKNLQYLFGLYQEEKKEYETFLEKEGFRIGTYIENIDSVIEKYQKSRGINHQKGDRLFGDSYRDLLLKEIVENNYDEIINTPVLHKQTISLLKIMKTYPETCNFFLEKTKENKIINNQRLIA